MTQAASDLTQEEKERAFRRATNSFERAPDRWTERARIGLTDEQLEQALKYELGLMGSSSAGDIGVTYQGAGLKVWADRCIGSTRNAPILEGKQTVSFARRVYGIADPNEKQMGLF